MLLISGIFLYICLFAKKAHVKTPMVSAEGNPPLSKKLSPAT
jgi:hypothetical protein